MPLWQIDIYPAESEGEALRVELFDDEVENLTLFDPLTGEVLRKVPRYTVYPKSHYVTPRETVLDAVEQIKEELRERLEQLRNQGKLVEEQRLSQRTRHDIEMMLELGYCQSIENYSRYLSGRAAGEADSFYGYYTLHFLKDGEIEGMLSVHGSSGDVWYHSWHGGFIAMAGEHE